MKYAMEMVLDSFGDKGKELVDSMVEQLFGNICSSRRTDYPRINFSHGITNLTRVTANERVGIVFAFSQVLLSRPGYNLVRELYTSMIKKEIREAEKKKREEASKSSYDEDDISSVSSDLPIPQCRTYGQVQEEEFLYHWSG